MTARLFEFGVFVMDTQLKRLLKDGVPVPLAHRGLALLAALVSADGRVVSKSELMDVAWPGQEVEESNLSVQIAALRKSIGVRPDGEDWIATVPRVGYQFLQAGPKGKEDIEGDVKKWEDPAGTRPSIAVLPFTNLSASREQEFFADGMTDDIITALSRVGELFVIARSSSFTFKDQVIRAPDAAKELGVRYVLEGSVRVAGERVRVNAQLIDAITGNNIWTERYEGKLDDIFAVQDEITYQIVLALEIKLARGETARLWESQTKNLRAWEKTVVARAVLQRYTTADTATARRLLEESLEIDPGYTGARALLGITHYWDARFSLSLDAAKSIELGERQVGLLFAADSKMSAAYVLKGAFAFMRDQHDEAVSLAEQAVKLSPGDARALAFLGMFLVFAGQPEKAFPHLTSAMAGTPKSDSWYRYYLTLANLWTGRGELALQSAELYVQQEPNEPYGFMYLAAINEMQLRHDQAIMAIAKLREKSPAFGIANVRRSERYRQPERMQILLEALNRTGLTS